MNKRNLNTHIKSFIYTKGAANIELEELCTDSSHCSFFLIHFKNQKLICKMLYDSTLAGHKRSILHEYRALKIAYSLGIGPKPISYSSKEKTLIMEYVEHTDYDAICLNSVLTRAKLARRLASVVPNKNSFYKRHYSFKADFKKHKKLLHEIIVRKNINKKKITEIIRLLELSYKFCLLYNDALINSKFVFSHNDLVGDNVLLGKDKKNYIIDFETVGLSTYDFIVGQLSVDAEIDWHLNATKNVVERNALYQLLINITGFKVSYKLFIARMVERFVQNMIYGTRQICIYEATCGKEKYIEKKKVVVDYCIDQLRNMIENQQ